MAEVRTAQEAVQVAEQFLLKYYAFRRPHKAVREDGTWLVEFDVGVLRSEIARIRVDAGTGDIVEYKGPGAV